MWISYSLWKWLFLCVLNGYIPPFNYEKTMLTIEPTMIIIIWALVQSIMNTYSRLAWALPTPQILWCLSWDWLSCPINHLQTTRVFLSKTHSWSIEWRKLWGALHHKGYYHLWMVKTTQQLTCLIESKCDTLIYHLYLQMYALVVWLEAVHCHVWQ